MEILNLGILKQFPIPLPPIEEQKIILDEVDDQFSVIDHLETDLDSKVKSAQSLRQAILCHAFTGRLVTQDPEDEPASELLKRIAAERECRAHACAAVKRSKTPASIITGRRGRSKKTKPKDNA
jgi:type I restriction enzyme S subunit